MQVSTGQCWRFPGLVWVAIRLNYPKGLRPQQPGSLQQMLRSIVPRDILLIVKSRTNNGINNHASQFYFLEPCWTQAGAQLSTKEVPSPFLWGGKEQIASSYLWDRLSCLLFMGYKLEGSLLMALFNCDQLCCVTVEIGEWTAFLLIEQ